MSIKSAPYFWLQCDHPGCEAKSTDGSDYSAYRTEDHAIEDARDEFDWAISSDESRHLCPVHSAAYTCSPCGEIGDVELPELDGERVCSSCLAELTRETPEPKAISDPGFMALSELDEVSRG